MYAVQEAVIRALTDQLGEATTPNLRDALQEQLAEEVTRLGQLVEWVRETTRQRPTKG